MMTETIFNHGWTRMDTDAEMPCVAMRRFILSVFIRVHPWLKNFPLHEAKAAP